MSSRIAYQDQFFYVSNSSFGALIEFGLEVAQKSSETETERDYVSNLRERTNTFYPGYDLVIEREFPSRDERKFWARVFFDLSHSIFCREVGKHDVNFWQSSMIGDAYLLGRIITRSVQEEEQGWHPKTKASIETEIFHKNINVRL